MSCLPSRPAISTAFPSRPYRLSRLYQLSQTHSHEKWNTPWRHARAKIPMPFPRPPIRPRRGVDGRFKPGQDGRVRS